MVEQKPFSKQALPVQEHKTELQPEQPASLSKSLSSGSAWKTAVTYSIALSLTGALGFLCGSIFLNLYNHLQRQWHASHQAQLEEAELSRQAGDFATCLSLSTLPSDSPFYHQSIGMQQVCQKGADVEKLRSARQLAFVDGWYVEAIALVHEIASPSLQNDVQQFVDDCSRRLLELTSEYYSLGILENALYTANAVPNNSVFYSQAQSLMRWMKVEWTEQQNHYERANAFLKVDRLDEALYEAQQISHPSWHEKIQPVLESISQRRLHLEALVAQARHSLSQNAPLQAEAGAKQLPNVEPWLSQKSEILAQAESMQTRTFIQQILTWGMVLILIVMVLFFR